MWKPNWLVAMVLAAMAIWLAFHPANGKDRLSRDLQRTLERGRSDLLIRGESPDFRNGYSRAFRANAL